MRREGPLDPRRAARIIARSRAALDAAHAAGLVHRDVKPANVLLGQGDHAYLTDFGLTKHVAVEAGATKPGHWVGTIDYVAPEQIRGRARSTRGPMYTHSGACCSSCSPVASLPAGGSRSEAVGAPSQPPPRRATRRRAYRRPSTTSSAARSRRTRRTATVGGGPRPRGARGRGRRGPDAERRADRGGGRGGTHAARAAERAAPPVSPRGRRWLVGRGDRGRRARRRRR